MAGKGKRVHRSIESDDDHSSAHKTCQIIIDKYISSSDDDESGAEEGVLDGDRRNPRKYQLTEEEERRYKYLLGDSDLLESFLEAKRRGESPLNALTKHVQARNSPSLEEEDRRHRKSERDEDSELFVDVDGDDDDKAPLMARVFTSSPPYVKGGKMREYQIEGLNWLINLHEHNISGILADEMGLGKTLQSLSLLGYLKNYKDESGPHLLIVPKSTLQNWKNEVAKWIPSLHAFIFHGDKERRAALIKEHFKTLDFDICITSYEMCLSEKAALRKIHWSYIMIDEAHRIKNESSKLSAIVREFHSTHRLLITGTPLQNNLHELWALLNFLLPDIFESSLDFDEWFTQHGGQQDEMVKQLRLLLQPFLLRRLKSDVEHSLLPKKEVNLYVGMTAMQKAWYRNILERDIGAVNGLIGGGGGGAAGKREGSVRLLNIMMQLRKCCNHPYLFDGAEPGPPYTTDEHLIDNSGKMRVLDKLLRQLKENGSRVLLFSQMSRVLDILEDYCQFRGYESCRIDGQTAHEDRIAAIDEYNRPGSEKFIFLLTTRAGGLGINLATADIVILFDSDWNPQVDLQAQDRAHRIGQTKQVCVFRMVTEGSVEEKVIEKALQKLRLDQLVIQQGKMTNVNKPLTQAEMLTMIRHGAQQILQSPINNDDGNASGEDDKFDIAKLLQRGEEKTKELLDKYSNVGYEDLQKFSISAPIEGVAPANSHNGGSSLAMPFLQPLGRRERKSNYGVDNYFREALGTGGGSGPRKTNGRPPVPKNQPKLLDFHFYPKALPALLKKERLAYQKSVGYKVTNAEHLYSDDSENDEDDNKAMQAVDKESEAIKEAMRTRQSEIDNAEPLSPEESKLKDELIAQGHSNWNRREYFALVRAIEKYGKAVSAEQISAEFIPENKSISEISSYLQAFWERLDELGEAEKIKGIVEKWEEKDQRARHIQSLLTQKLAHHKTLKNEPSLHYAGTRGKQFTVEEDQFILVQMASIGFGHPDLVELLRERIMNEPIFRFDWFIKTRTDLELQRRCTKIVGLVEKEWKMHDGAFKIPRR